MTRSGQLLEAAQALGVISATRLAGKSAKPGRTLAQYAALGPQRWETQRHRNCSTPKHEQEAIPLFRYQARHLTSPDVPVDSDLADYLIIGKAHTSGPCVDAPYLKPDPTLGL